MGSYLFIMAYYPLAIYMLEFKFLPSSSNNRVVNLLQYLGKASYQVFLIQILFFAFLYNP
jgi:peptidoglycan/LPS O-acetylase OafA/YrhL